MTSVLSSRVCQRDDVAVWKLTAGEKMVTEVIEEEWTVKKLVSPVGKELVTV